MPAISSNPTPPLRRTPEGLRLAVRLQPAASAQRIAGIEVAGDGTSRLRVKVTAVAEDGKANRALIKLLAKTWRLPAGCFELVAGTRARNKVLQIADAPQDGIERVERWIRARGEEEVA